MKPRPAATCFLMPTKFRGLLTISLLLALAIFLVPVGIPIPTNVVFPLAGLWLFLLGFTLVTHGKLGLWLLIGFPLALFWPIFFAFYLLGYVDIG
jgi:hypothetical protein